MPSGKRSKQTRKENSVNLTEVEKLTLENKKLKVSDLQKEGDLVVARYRDKIQAAASDHKKYFTNLCEKHSKKPEDVEKIDLEKGIIIFKETDK